MKERRLRIAIQKSGRLYEGSMEILNKCGLNIAYNKKELFFKVRELPIDILFIRDDDIPEFVANGVCDLGIIGENVFKEAILSSKSVSKVQTVLNLGFSKCRLSIAKPKETKFKTIQDLNGLNIATSYPLILSQYLKKNKIKAKIITMEGAVEVVSKLQIADAICDIVVTGSTLESNGLDEFAKVLKSEAVLIKNNAISEEKQKIMDILLKRLEGVVRAKDSKYIMLNAPKAQLDKVITLLPGADSPTIMELADKTKVAVHAVCLEPVFWDTLEKLTEAGATAILVMPIEKIMD